MGCLRATGRERLLARYDFQTIDGADVGERLRHRRKLRRLARRRDRPALRRLAARPSTSSTSAPASAESTLGGQQVGCEDYSYSCNSAADQLVLNADGFTAVHTTVTLVDTTSGAEPRTEQIVAGDSTGTHVEDTTSAPFANAPLSSRPSSSPATR